MANAGANPATNRLPTPTYDAAGNVIADGKSYAYNAMGLLTQVNSGQLCTYRYDAMGRRAKRSWSYSDNWGPRSGSIVYVYGVKGEILAEYKNETTSRGTENTVANNIHRDGQMIAQHVTGTNCYGYSIDQEYRLERNHLGQIIASVGFGMYSGNTLSTLYPRPFSSGGSDQFPGQKDDPESGLKDFGARYYNPSMSRWTSPDSIMAHPYDPQSLNKYAYVRNDPVNLVDPDGRDPNCITGADFCVQVIGQLPSDPSFIRFLLGGGESIYNRPVPRSPYDSPADIQQVVPILEGADKGQNKTFKKAWSMALSLLKEACADLF